MASIAGQSSSPHGTLPSTHQRDAVTADNDKGTNAWGRGGLVEVVAGVAVGVDGWLVGGFEALDLVAPHPAITIAPSSRTNPVATADRFAVVPFARG